MALKSPYLLFIGDVPDPLAAKTAQGVVDWRPERVVGQMRLPGCGADLGVADMGIEEGAAAGAKTFVIGAVNAGGVLKEDWIGVIVEAMDAGMDVASGLHVRLRSVPAIAEAATRNEVELHDLRHSDHVFATGKGTKRSGKRLLAVGTDCSVGKKYSALCLERDMKAAGFSAEFCATGQTGILIAERGIALDAVIADFISGAAEWITPECDENHWQVVEGQGSLFHPSFSGVTLGLLHGSQPDAFVVCHEPTRTTMRGVETRLPTIQQVIDMTTSIGKLTNPDIQCVGICVNTLALAEDEAKAYLASVTEEYGLPATDPLRFGGEAIVAELENRFGK
ncbi:MAG: N-acetyltransferase DgcN [Pseudomonadota bacterium]